MVPSPVAASGVKRTRDGSEEALPSQGPKPVSPSTANSNASSATAFRNVSACHRCRMRKNRCDQHMPACSSCEKAGVNCVGYDPITKREIPRSYVYYMETRVEYLESLLREHSVTFRPAEELASRSKPKSSPDVSLPGHENDGDFSNEPKTGGQNEDSRPSHVESSDREKMNKLVSNIGLVSVQGASESFARVVFSAVRSSVSGTSSERGSIRPSRSIPGAAAAGGGTSMRDSFFGLHRKPTIPPAPFPDKELGFRLVELYFEYANPQIPILHRGEFEALVERVYRAEERVRTPRELYMLNMVFAIGAGIILKAPEPKETSGSNQSTRTDPPISPSRKRRRVEGVQYQPEEYHASAFVHLENFLGSSPATDRPDGFGTGLEELQAVLLLAGFALLRPVPPGLWYIVGVAVRLAVDLGLHYEDGIEIDRSDRKQTSSSGIPSTSVEGRPSERTNRSSKIDPKEKGRREWVRDLRRRLWWCVYSFDRLVSTCVGRPFGVSDAVITTEFPSMLDDKYIEPTGLAAPFGDAEPSYKNVARHYFRLRLLQSEILQVLHYRQAQQARARGVNDNNNYMHTKLSSPFLRDFDSFKTWRADINHRLDEWRTSAPTKRETGVRFSPLFFELNYWQAIIMLYRQGLVVPPVLAGELGSANNDASNPILNSEDQDNEESVFLKVAEAGQQVLNLYQELHRVHLVNYTFLATHHLFLAGISFLYAIWHSVAVRRRLSPEEVNQTVYAATSVLGDLMDKCPPAEACKEAFQRMAKATVKMVLASTGFSSHKRRTGHRDTKIQHGPGYGLSNLQTALPPEQSSGGEHQANRYQPTKQPAPRFDMNFGDLFGDQQTDLKLSERSDLKFEQSNFADQKTRPIPPPLAKQESTSATYSQLTSPEVSPTTTMPRSYPAVMDPSTGTQVLPPFESDFGRIQQQPPAHAQEPPLQSPFTDSSHLSFSNDSQSLQQYSDANANYNDLGFLDAFAGDTLSSASTDPSGMGMDLGFMGVGGMGWDGSHDWADGNGIDLFDGFWFGGAGMGNGNM